MNRLPAVLQKEIWEYVHGDRAFWQNKMTSVLSILPRNLQLGFREIVGRYFPYEMTFNGKEMCGFDNVNHVIYLDDGARLQEEFPGQTFDIWCNVRGNKLPRFGGRIAEIKPLITIRPPIPTRSNKSIKSKRK